jgi:PAS domain S-box-containing protein
MSDTHDREDPIEESFDWLTILNSVSQMVWIMKPSGKIIWANQTHLNYFGGTFEELVINNKAWERIHPEDLEKTWGAVQEWRALNKEKNLEYRLKNKDGIYLWHLAQVSMIRQENNDPNSIKYFVGTITNIHEQVSNHGNFYSNTICDYFQKMVDEKAKLFEQQLKAVANHAPVVVWAMDVNGIFTQYIGKRKKKPNYVPKKRKINFLLFFPKATPWRF